MDDKVVLAHIHPGDVSASFAHSVIGLELFDLAGNQRLINNGRFGFSASIAGAGQLPKARNELCRVFLDAHQGADWLFMVDSDMGFEQDILERLLAAADPVERPVMGGLCFGVRTAGVGACQAIRSHVFPTIYRWAESEDNYGFDPVYDYPRDAVCEVAGTGAACILIHRSVLEKIGESWFDVEPYRDGWFSEDLSFCRRVRRHGFKIHVHTGAKTSHHKSWWVDEQFFDLLRRQSAGRSTYVVIPVKDQLAMTRRVVAELVKQGGYEKILIFDNGSGPETRKWLEEQDVADVFDAAGANIHEMWNAGIAQAQTENPGADVVILNNDLELGPDFLNHLTHALHSDPTLLAVSANYDGRRFEGVVEPVRGVCAGRYDGSGGFAGFAFAARGDFLDSGYRFPEELTWWWGDNHLLATIEQAGGWYGIAKHATCVHLDGGSVTSRTLDQEEFAQQCENDRQTFRRLMGLDEDDQPGMPAEDSQMVLPAPSEQR